jgi:photosynthetic reaction center H subunit
MDEIRGGVVPLAELDDARVSGDAPDIRGWDVVAADGRRIGAVDELLVEPEARKVRYLDVELDAEATGVSGDEHVLIPVGYARLDRASSRVRVEGMEGRAIAGLPRYDQGPIRRGLEHSTLAGMPSPPVPADGQSFYACDAFDPGRCFGAEDAAAALDADWRTRSVGQVADL